MVDKKFKKLLLLARKVNLKLSKVKVGLPKRVEFKYAQGIVICYPKERKWIVKPKGKKQIIHVLTADQRNDVTKYKARRFLKLGIVGLLRSE